MKNSAINVGDRFGHLTVIGVRHEQHRGNSYFCRCDCGKEIAIGGAFLVDGPRRRGNKSCGCAHDRQHGVASEYPRIYAAWKEMNKRCYQESSTSYKRYGAKGISVCDKWRHDATGFVAWALDNGYADGLEIDRIDPAKSYCPENCRWVDQFIQAQNKGVCRRNKTGVTGVCRGGQPGKFRAYIMRFGAKINLGVFDSLAEAAAVRRAAEQQYSSPESVGALA